MPPIGAIRRSSTLADFGVSDVEALRDLLGFVPDELEIFLRRQQNSSPVNASLTDLFGLEGTSADFFRASSFRLALRYVEIYCMPVIALVGIVANLMAFVVFVSTYMRRLSSSIYRAALSLADIGFLFCFLLSWAQNINLEVYSRRGLCQIFTYFTYVCGSLGIWYVVAFTVERYVAVCFPLLRQKVCTTRKARYVVFSLAISAAIFYSFAFGLWTSGEMVPLLSGATVCVPLAGHRKVVSVLHNLDTVVTLILPFCIILVINVRIACRVVSFYRQRNNMAGECSFVTSNVGDGSTAWIRRRTALTRQSLHRRTRFRVTRMLLIVTTAFLVLNLPRHVTRTYSFIMSLRHGINYLPPSDFITWEKFSQILYHFHFSITIFLYSALGKDFRKAFAWLRRRCNRGLLQRVNKCFSWCSPTLELRTEATTRERFV